MGYDCYIRQPRDERPEIDWSSEASREDYHRWADVNYFRRNIWGGTRLAEALVDMGMGFNAERYARVPDFPNLDDFGVTWDDEGEPVGERAKEYQAEVDRVLDWHGPEIPGIPVHKICGTNDGWHVTREECRAALGLYDKAVAAGRAHPEAFDTDFIPFLREAAARDGFEVH